MHDTNKHDGAFDNSDTNKDDTDDDSTVHVTNKTQPIQPIQLSSLQSSITSQKDYDVAATTFTSPGISSLQNSNNDIGHNDNCIDCGDFVCPAPGLNDTNFIIVGNNTSIDINKDNNTSTIENEQITDRVTKMTKLQQNQQQQSSSSTRSYYYITRATAAGKQCINISVENKSNNMIRLKRRRSCKNSNRRTIHSTGSSSGHTQQKQKEIQKKKKTKKQTLYTCTNSWDIIRQQMQEVLLLQKQKQQNQRIGNTTASLTATMLVANTNNNDCNDDIKMCRIIATTTNNQQQQQIQSNDQSNKLNSGIGMTLSQTNTNDVVKNNDTTDRIDHDKVNVVPDVAIDDTDRASCTKVVKADFVCHDLPADGINDDDCHHTNQNECDKLSNHCIELTVGTANRNMTGEASFVGHDLPNDGVDDDDDYHHTKRNKCDKLTKQNIVPTFGTANKDMAGEDSELLNNVVQDIGSNTNRNLSLTTPVVATTTTPTTATNTTATTMNDSQVQQQQQQPQPQTSKRLVSLAQKQETKLIQYETIYNVLQSMYNIDKQCLPRGVISLVAKQFNYSKTTISKIWTTGQQSIILQQQQQQQEQILQQQNLPHLEIQQQENPLREIANTVALSSLATASSSSSSTQSNYMNNINANSKNIIIKPIFSTYSKRIYIQKYDVPMMLQKLESIPLIERTSLRKCAELLNVSSSSLHKWIKNYRADYCNNIENQCNNTTTTTTVPVSNYLLDSKPTSTGNDNTTSSTTTCNTINSISTSADNSISINNNNNKNNNNNSYDDNSKNIQLENDEIRLKLQLKQQRILKCKIRCSIRNDRRRNERTEKKCSTVSSIDTNDVVSPTAGTSTATNILYSESTAI